MFPLWPPNDLPRTGQVAMEARALAHLDLDLPFFGRCQLSSMHCDSGNARQRQVEDNRTALWPWLREEAGSAQWLLLLVLNSRQYYPDTGQSTGWSATPSFWSYEHPIRTSIVSRLTADAWRIASHLQGAGLLPTPWNRSGTRGAPHKIDQKLLIAC